VETTHEPETLTWTVWPAAKRPGLSVTVAVLSLALSGVAWWSFGSKWYAVITLVVLTGALARHFFRTRYDLEAEGVRRRCFLTDQRWPWASFRMAIAGPDGMLLSPHGPPDAPPTSRRFWKQVVAIYFPADGADAVRACVAARLPLREWAEVQAWLKTRQ
jgi:hypothetical protein